jgi:tubulin--tyrosine ligase-like protein 12
MCISGSSLFNSLCGNDLTFCCPVCLASIDKDVFDGLSGLEIYNSHFTSKAGEWALGFCADIVGADNPCSSVESTLFGSIGTIDLSDRCIHKLPEVSNATDLL